MVKEEYKSNHCWYISSQVGLIIDLSWRVCWNLIPQKVTALKLSGVKMSPDTAATKWKRGIRRVCLSVCVGVCVCLCVCGYVCVCLSVWLVKMNPPQEHFDLLALPWSPSPPRVFVSKNHQMYPKKTRLFIGFTSIHSDPCNVIKVEKTYGILTS